MLAEAIPVQHDYCKYAVQRHQAAEKKHTLAGGAEPL